ncbi:wd repeat protein pop3 [Phaffia rhodozyma]|uniref:Protein LST8 homolog n=1 Tax=Phaffia rhodozyma TaxID=264483 RepID=A0A0F7SNN1_PHARH|nr:wd repeat protein pop3 [Phaffia rhodozyma]
MSMTHQQHPAINQAGGAAGSNNPGGPAASANQPHPPQPPVPQQDLSVILVTGGYDHTIKFWEAWSGICGRTIQNADSKQITRLAISPDKKILAVAGHHHVKLYDIQNPSNNAPLATFEGHTGNITSLAFHCEGKWIVTGSEDGSLKIWDTRTSHIQRNYDHRSPVNDVVIHPNQGELVSCDQDGSVKVWDLAENTCTHELVPDADVPIRSIAIASDGSMLVAGNNKGNVYVWKFEPGSDTDLQPVTMFPAHPGKYITRVLLSPDVKHLATCSSDKRVKIWSTENYEFKLEKTLDDHQRWVWDAAFSADSAYLVTASSDHIARLWELATGEVVRQYTGHHRACLAVALNDINLA